jgi:hypothetical protein
MRRFKRRAGRNGRSPETPAPRIFPVAQGIPTVASAAKSLAPEEVLALAPEEADRWLEALARAVPRHEPCVQLPETPGGSAFVFGDTHGDWRSTLEVVRAFREGGADSVLLGLGDYVDRSPADLPSGSVANALFLLGLAAELPRRVFLLQGNHETMRRLAGRPHTLAADLERLWGTRPTRYDRVMELLERGPLAATSASGAYFAHAGFPRDPLPPRWRDAFTSTDDQRLAELVWAEPDVASAHRGVVPSWTEADLGRFLSETGLLTVWRGHDPDLAGRPLYRGRAMTLHTTRIYRQYGGVLLAVLPLTGRLGDVRDAELRHLERERRPDPP